jgi:hypothetical protein
MGLELNARVKYYRKKPADVETREESNTMYKMRNMKTKAETWPRV